MSVTVDPPSDAELLRRYIESASDEAFGQLVARHMPFVQAVAERQVFNSRSLADDVAQATLIVLARRPRAAAKAASLRGWLHGTTCYVAANARRANQRRNRHERAAIAADAPSQSSPMADELAILDAALQSMRAADRDAVILHHAEGRSLAEVGARLGVSAEAAKKRVQRATAALRTLLTRRGISATSFAGFVPLAPSADLTPLANSNGSAVTLAQKVLVQMRWTTMKLAAAIALAAGVAVTGGVVAIAQVAGQAPSPVTVAPPTPLKTTIAGNVTIELLALRRDDEEKWWRPDGTPFDGSPVPAGYTLGAPRKWDVPTWQSWQAAYRVMRPIGTTFNARFDVVPYSAVGAGPNGLVALGAELPGPPGTTFATTHVLDIHGLKRSTQIDLRVGVQTSGEFQTLAAVDRTGQEVGGDVKMRLVDAGGSARRRFTDGLYVHWGRPFDRDGDACVDVFDNFPDEEHAIVAIDTLGVEHPMDLSGGMFTESTGDWQHHTIRARFDGLPLARVERFELRYRPLTKIRFEHVALGERSAADATRPTVVLGGIDTAGPADQAIEGPLNLPADTLQRVFEEIEAASGVRIEVEWAAFAEYQPVNPDSLVRAISLDKPSPATAVRAAFEAAGGRDYTLVVSDDGKTVRLVTGQQNLVGGDGRAVVPGREW